MLRFLIGIICILLYIPKKLTLEFENPFRACSPSILNKRKGQKYFYGLSLALLTTKRSCLEKNNFGHTIVHSSLLSGNQSDKDHLLLELIIDWDFFPK